MLTNWCGDMLISGGSCCASTVLEDLSYKCLKCEVPLFILRLFMKESLLLLNHLDVLLLLERMSMSCTTCDKMKRLAREMLNPRLWRSFTSERRHY